MILQKSTQAFFGLNGTNFWNVSEDELCLGVKTLFEKYVADAMPEFSLQGYSNFWDLVTSKRSEIFDMSNNQETTNYTYGNITVGTVGEMHHGKSTVSKYLVDKYNYFDYAFAGPLKKGCQILFQLTYEQLYGNEKEVTDPRWGVTPRYLLQKIGTELFRQRLLLVLPHLKIPFNNIWIANYIYWRTGVGRNVSHCVSDIRFQDEAECVKKYNQNCVIVKVIRPQLLHRQHGENQHVSETELNKIQPDEILINDATLENLFEKVDHMLQNQ